jgi:hypothetical protein
MQISVHLAAAALHVTGPPQQRAQTPAVSLQYRIGITRLRLSTEFKNLNLISAFEELPDLVEIEMAISDDTPKPPPPEHLDRPSTCVSTPDDECGYLTAPSRALICRITHSQDTMSKPDDPAST